MGYAKVLGGAMLMAVFGVLDDVCAWRPLTIDDADTVEPGFYELDAGVAYSRGAHLTHWDFPFGLTYGVARDLDAHFSFGGQIDEQSEPFLGTRQQSGVGDLELGAKWHFVESDPFGIRTSLAPLVKLPTADKNKGLGSGATDYDLTWIISRKCGEQADLHINLGHTWVGEADDVVHGGFAAYYLFTDSLQWVGEVFAEKAIGGDAVTLASVNTGLRFYVVDAVVLDVAAGTKIRGDAPDFTMTTGLTWDFEFGALLHRKRDSSKIN